MKKAINFDKIENPTKPRFTLETLQEIRIATGDGESTIAAYRQRLATGAIVEKYAAFEDLTQAEKIAAFAFMLKYCKTQIIRRKGKPRGRAVNRTHTAPRSEPPPLDLSKIEFEPLEINIEQ